MRTDNSVVFIASNWDTHETISKMKRRESGGDQKKFTKPYTFSFYNQEMERTDVMDKSLASNQPFIKDKKWHQTIFVHAFNELAGAVQKSRCKKNQEKLFHLELRLEIMVCLLKLDEPISTNAGPRTSSNLPDDVRFDGVNHFMTSIIQGYCKLGKTIH